MHHAELDVIILAAGKGTRMHSCTPKVLHEVAGKPLLEHVIDSVQALNPDNIFVVVGHQKERVIETIQNDAIQWVEQKKQLGTGHATQQALLTLNKTPSPNHKTLILTADVPLIQAETLERFVQHLNTFSLAVLSAILENPFGLGRIIRNDSQELCAIIEEKDASNAQKAIQEINSGIVCARTHLLTQWLGQLGTDNQQNEYYLTDIVGIAHAENELITAYCIQDNTEVQGINDRIQLAHVERLYQQRQAKKWMSKGVTILDPQRIDIRGDVNIGKDTIIDVNTVIIGPTTIGENVHIEANCVIKQSYIKNDSHIHSHSVIEESHIESKVNIGPFARLRPGTHLSTGVKIGNFVEIKNASLDQEAKVNHLSYIGDASVGKSTNIGAGVITCNYDGANKHKTLIGEEVFVGSDCQLIAPVTIKDGATIGAGSTISNNVDNQQLAISRAKQRNIDNWVRPSKKIK